MRAASAQLVSSFFAGLGRCSRQVHGQLTLWPLVGAPVAGAHPYHRLAEAVAAGAIAVHEIDGGEGPSMVVENRAAAVLVLIGERIRSPRSSQTARATFLVPSHGRVHVDPPFAELRRWSARPPCSRRPESSPAGRPRAGGSHPFRLVRGQIGFVAALGARVVGLEAIGRPEVFAACFGALLEGYLDDAEGPEAAAPSGTASFAAPESFVGALLTAHTSPEDTLGLGSELRLQGDRVSGCALLDGGIVHLSAFAVEGDELFLRSSEECALRRGSPDDEPPRVAESGTRATGLGVARLRPVA